MPSNDFKDSAMVRGTVFAGCLFFLFMFPYSMLSLTFSVG